jgi:membrane protein DedA with SNARE-associated domain
MHSSFFIHPGYLGIVVLMVLSPVPPDVFMPLAGFLASQKELNFWYVVLVGTLGFVISVLPWYFAGRYFGKHGVKQLPSRYRRWLSLSPEGLEKANRWFQQRGKLAIAISFLLPAVRNLIWVPAGMSGMSFASALLYSVVGGFLYILAVTYAGYILGNHYYLVKEYLGSVYNVVLPVLAIAIAVWGVKSYLKRRKLL